MKKINSNAYGGKVMGVGAIFLLVIPLILFIINQFVELYILTVLMWSAIAIGVLIELGFFAIWA